MEENTAVVLRNTDWEYIVEKLVHAYEVERDTLDVGNVDAEEWWNQTLELDTLRSYIRRIQEDVGETWYEFIMVGLWDKGRKVEVVEACWDYVEVQVEGYEYPVAVKRNFLNWVMDELEEEELDDAGIDILWGPVVLVLYLDDIHYLLELMNK